MLELAGYDIKNPIEYSKILQNSDLTENEFNSVINFLISNGWISKFRFTPINAYDSNVIPDHYVVEKSGLSYLWEQSNEDKSTPIYNVNIHQHQVSNSPTQIGTGNTLNNIHIQSINTLLVEVETCIAKSKPSEETRSKITSSIQRIRNSLSSLNILNLKNELWHLYQNLSNIASCIMLALKIPDLLSQLPT